MEFKVVLGAKDGKSYQKEIKSPEADHLLKRRIGEKFSGEDLGYSGYEFEITGGSDKCGFPMRKGIQEPRKSVLIGEGVGFLGKKRKNPKKGTRKKQKGLLRRRTVCGEMITKIIHQVNLKVLKEGSQKLGEDSEEPVAAEVPVEGKIEEVPKQEEPKQKDLPKKE
jgi:small subunit ribosomal protein S6e